MERWESVQEMVPRIAVTFSNSPTSSFHRYFFIRFQSISFLHHVITFLGLKSRCITPGISSYLIFEFEKVPNVPVRSEPLCMPVASIRPLASLRRAHSHKMAQSGESTRIPHYSHQSKLFESAQEFESYRRRREMDPWRDGNYPEKNSLNHAGKNYQSSYPSQQWTASYQKERSTQYDSNWRSSPSHQEFQTAYPEARHDWNSHNHHQYYDQQSYEQEYRQESSPYSYHQHSPAPSGSRPYSSYCLYPATSSARQPSSPARPGKSRSSTPVATTGRIGAKREKVQREGPPPVPSPQYLAGSEIKPRKIVISKHNPPLLILDLNNTLLVREARSRQGSRRPVVRNYLSTFLQYICGPFKSDPSSPSEQGSRPDRFSRRWKTIVYSSAKRENVYSMCEAIGLIPKEVSTPRSIVCARSQSCYRARIPTQASLVAGDDGINGDRIRARY